MNVKECAPEGYVRTVVQEGGKPRGPSWPFVTSCSGARTRTVRTAL